MESIIRWYAEHMEWWESVIFFSIAVYEKPGSVTLNQWAPASIEKTLEGTLGETLRPSAVVASEDQAATLQALLEKLA